MFLSLFLFYYDLLKIFIFLNLSNLAQGASTSAISLIGTNHVNSFQAIAPLTAHKKGVHFLGEYISLKN
jgi:hypothetical protein